MSLGSRIARRGGTRALARLTPPHREPLPFLYPAWIKHSSTSSPPVTENSTTRRANRADNARAPNTGIRDGNDAVPVEAEASKWGHDETKGGLRDSTTGDSGEDFFIAKDDDKSATAHDQNPNTSFGEEDSRGTETRFQNEYHRTPDSKPLVRRLLGKNQNEPYRPLEPKQLVRRLLGKNSMAAKAKVHVRNTRMEYHEEKRKSTGSWEPDWRAVLSALRNHTPRDAKWLEKALQITVPLDAVETLMYGVDTNMWKIAIRYNCTITLGKMDPHMQLYNSYFLSGSATAIKLATLDLLRIVPNMKLRTASKSFDPSTSTSVAISSDDVGDSNALSVGYEEPGFSIRPVASMVIRPIQSMRAEKFPRPKSWTKRSLLDFVYDLTNMNMPTHLYKLLYRGTGATHIGSVSNILRDLFDDPECQHALSQQAFDTAMAYFMTTRQLDDVKHLFLKMEKVHIQPDVQTFNIMLQAAAKHEDLHNFHYILHMMLRRDIAPNPATWLAFMSATIHTRIKYYILADMRERGLLTHTRVIQGLLELLAPYEARTSLQNSESHEEFLRRLDSTYGPKWLNLTSANQILHVLSSEGLVSRCWEFMKVMEERGILPDPKSVAVVMHNCRYTNNITGAIEFLRDLPSFVPQELNDDVYHHLFQIACQLKALNVARVVWRYACLNAATTGKMTHHIRYTLAYISSNFTDSKNAQHRWQSQLGYFAIGHTGLNGQTFTFARYNDPDPPATEEERSTGLTVRNHQSGNFLFPPVFPGNRESRPELLREIDERMREEISVFEEWEPVKPFADMLAEAWERDAEWKNIVNEAWKRGDVETQNEVVRLPWRIQRAISIPVRHRWREEEREWT